MSKLIPQSFIEDLLAKVDIADVVGTRVKLRKAGSNLLGLCPFHSEKTPSFTVSSDKQFFHCFGCSAHGSAISFVMQFDNLGFIEAVENLSSQVGLIIPRSAKQDETRSYSDLYRINEEVVRFFENELIKSPQAIEYLKSRGLTGEICKKFKVGYAPSDWESLSSVYGKSPEAKQHMMTAGLLTSKNDRAYSRFRNRIMFPIHNTRGKIIGFGGRSIDKDDMAKYLNSPETPIFHKGEELYGLYAAKKSDYNIKSILVVEGYLDVITLAQFGVTNAVATLGTAISTKQIQLLLRNVPEIIFCFDGDKAGRGAAGRALENMLPIMRDGIQIKFLFLPEGYDPDSLIRKEQKEVFVKRLAQATPLSDFFISQLSSGIDISNIDGKARLTKVARDAFKKMPNGVFQQLLLDKISKLVGVNPEEFKNRDFDYDVPRFVEENEHKERDLNIPVALQNVISILLHNPQLVDCIEGVDKLNAIKVEGAYLLSELISLIKKQPDVSLGTMLEYWRDRQEIGLINELSCKESIIPKDVLKNELSGIINLLEQIEREQIIQGLFAKATSEGLGAEERQRLQKLIEISKK